mgnify:CR=1 FL=1
MSLAVGVNHYLKYYCKVNISQVGDQSKMPESIVIVDGTIFKETKAKVRYSYNYCRRTRYIKNKYPDCAITLSLGERSYESYKALKGAGADRYLLRHETADCEHYGKLHPENLTLENRMECLKNLKEIVDLFTFKKSLTSLILIPIKPIVFLPYFFGFYD